MPADVSSSAPVDSGRGLKVGKIGSAGSWLGCSMGSSVVLVDAVLRCKDSLQ